MQEKLRKSKARAVQFPLCKEIKSVKVEAIEVEHSLTDKDLLLPTASFSHLKRIHNTL